MDPPEKYTVATDWQAFDEDALSDKPKRRKHGKPRRAKGIAAIRSVRIDDLAAGVLKQTFGTLGNALHHIYRGIVEFQEGIDLKYPPEPDPEADPKRAYPLDRSRLTDEDVDLIRSVIHREVDRFRGMDDRVLIPYLTALRKLERTLMGRKPGSPF